MKLRTPIAVMALAATAVFAGAQSYSYGQPQNSYYQNQYRANYQNQPINVTINGQAVAFNDAAPVMMNGRVLVPLRGVFEQMGAYVHWTQATQTVDANKGNTNIQLQIGNRTAEVNGQPVTMDVPAQLIGGSTMVPLRFVGEALGANVDWNNQANAVVITTPDNGQMNQSYAVNTYHQQVQTYVPNNGYPQGAVVNGDGSINYNGIVYPAGTTFRQDGWVSYNGYSYPPGTVINPDGSVTRNGVTYPAGVSFSTNGSFSYRGVGYPAGAIVNPNGTFTYNGYTYPAGVTFDADGRITYNGQTYPSGTVIRQDGTIVTPNGDDSYAYNTTGTILANTIVPVTLNTRLSSDRAEPGDTFTATVNANGGEYDGIPAGTVFRGHVVSAIPRSGDRPGSIQLHFDEMRMPDGQLFDINGQLAAMNDSNIIRTRRGIMEARGDNVSRPMVYVGYGAGAGAIIGALSHGNVLTDALIGGGLGFILGQVQQDRSNPHNIVLEPGTQMGVRLTQNVILR